MASSLLTMLVVSAIGLTSCGAGNASAVAADRDHEQTMPTKTIEETLKSHTDALMAISGVVGVGQGLLDNTRCIKVFVVEKTADLERRIPAVLDGHPVLIQQSGPIKALPKSAAPK